MKPARRPSLEFRGLVVRPGRSDTGSLPVPSLVTGTSLSLPVRLIHGREDGPTVWISAAIHGDEIGGVEIIRRVLLRLDAKRMRGTVITVPIVNVHGFLTGDRYLPDRRDLNRSFPGSATGSIAGRVAHSFMTEIVARSDVGIDLHTGSDHRTNLPQIRGNLDDKRTRELAAAFGAPVMMHSKLRDGSLRAAATDQDVTVLLFEGGEAWRFDEPAIAAGASGVLRVLARLGVIDDGDAPDAQTPIECRDSTWVRARRSGVTSLAVGLGELVAHGQSLAVIHDALGQRVSRATSPFDGIVVGLTQHPLVHQGDAIVHVARRVGATLTPDAAGGGRTADEGRDPVEGAQRL